MRTLHTKQLAEAHIYCRFNFWQPLWTVLSRNKSVQFFFYIFILKCTIWPQIPHMPKKNVYCYNTFSTEYDLLNLNIKRGRIPNIKDIRIINDIYKTSKQCRYLSIFFMKVILCTKIYFDDMWMCICFCCWYVHFIFSFPIRKKDVLFSQSTQRPINDIKPLVDLSLHFKTNLYNLTFHFLTIV